MNLCLPSDQTEKLLRALAHAGASEIGGQLFGEQLAPSSFRITELSVQRRRGTFARFVVDLADAARAAVAFFRRTGHNYTRYNYVGEWHSHPSFAVEPSATDQETMRGLVSSPDFRGTFAVLMIVRLDDDQLLSGAWVFDAAGTDVRACLEVEHGTGG